MVGRVRIRTHTKLMGVLQTLGLTHVQPTRGLHGQTCTDMPEILRIGGMLIPVTWRVEIGGDEEICTLIVATCKVGASSSSHIPIKLNQIVFPPLP